MAGQATQEAGEPAVQSAAGQAQAADQTIPKDINSEDPSAVADPPAGDPPQQETMTLTQELATARQQAAENHDRYLRVHADMDNYKKRIERTYAELSRNAKKELLLKLLGVKDNLERALSYGNTPEQGENESVIQGVRLTEYQLDQLLRTEGVTPIEIKGQPFDPHKAEALTTVVDTSVPDHTVVQEVQRGYMYQDDQVLRPAKVVVAVHQPDEQP
jgi:molecular chaperone GrpE